jgi:hypothetical protein
MPRIVLNKQRRQRHLIGCLTIVASFGLQSYVSANASNRETPPVSDEPLATPSGPAACMPEFEAYLRVANLAREFGDDGEVFIDALDDLREKLAGCLEHESDPDIPDVRAQKLGNISANRSPPGGRSTDTFLPR